MKKYFTFLPAILFSLNAVSQTLASSGQLKISILSFKCINQSWDGLIEFDGPGNEVFINYAYRVFNSPASGTMKSGAAFTSVYGSTGNGRIKAGTADPYNGGIANGNEVTVNTVALNEHVDADNLILFSPSIWEWDNSNNNILNLFNQQLAMDLNWAMQQPYPFLNVPVNYNNPYEGRFKNITNQYINYRPAVKYSSVLRSLFNVQDNRPIGATAYDQTTVIYSPDVLILDTKVLMAVYNHNKMVSEINFHERPDMISGVVENVVTEETYAIATSNGSYSLKLKIEFTPDANVPAPPIKPNITVPNRPVNTIRPDMPIKGIKGVNLISVVGTWNGTQTNDDGFYPDAISFQLNNAGQFIMTDRSGAVAAKGTYTFSNNNFSASYKSYSDNQTFSLLGTYDPNTQNLNLTRGSGSSTTGQGKWIVKR